MLDIAFELIGEGTLNSLLMFCFFNLIIVMIFTGSSKPASMDSQDSTFVTPVSYNMCYIASDDHDCGDDEAMNVAAAVPSAQDEPIDDSSSDEEEDRESSHCYAADDDDADDDDDDGDDDEDDDFDDDDDDDDDDDESKEAEVEDEEGDDDLRKRVEEFIAKINNEWRHEKLRALNLVY